MKLAEIPGYGDDEKRFMRETVNAVRPRFVAEWGTNVGASARIWWTLTARYGTVIHSIEHPDAATHDHPGTERYAMCLDGVPRVRLRLHWGDGVTVAVERFVAAGKPDAAIFFLDGDHSYEAVCRELAVLDEAAPRATLVCHDTSHAIEETERAVEEFLERSGREAVWLASQAGMARIMPLTGRGV